LDKPQARLTGFQLALDRAPQFLSVILLFSLPILTQPKGTDPMLAKGILVQAIVFLMAGLWALRSFSFGRASIVVSRATVVLAFLALWCVASAALSPYPSASLLGLRDLAPFFLWYLLLTFTCTEAWRGENLLVVFLLTGLGTVLWALGQWTGWVPGHWSSVSKAFFEGRPIAGLGSPEALAGFLTLVWPMALGLWVRATHPLAKILWGSTAGLGLWVLFLTGSGPAWVGSLAGAAVFALVLLRKKGGKDRSWVVGLCLFIALSFLLPASRERIGSLLEKGTASAGLRQEVWGGALSIFRERPLEGSGPGTFWAAFPSRAPYPYGMREETPRVHRAGNWVLGWMAETGLVGTLLLLSFGYLVATQWWRLFSAHAVPPSLVAGSFAAVTATMVDGLFRAGGIGPTTLTGLLFLVALPVPLSQRFTRIPGFPLREKIFDLASYKPYLLPLLALVVAGCLWQLKDVFQRQAADVLLGKAMVAVNDGKRDEALALYDRVLGTDPFNFMAREERAWVLCERNTGSDADKAFADLEAAGRMASDAGSLHWMKFQVLMALDRRGEAAGELKAAVRLEPFRIKEIEAFRKAEDLLVRGRKVEALDAYMRLVADHPSCVPLMVDYAKALAAVGRTSDARMVLGDAVKLHPGNEGARRGLEALGGGAP